jgi:hypothetical protein
MTWRERLTELLGGDEIADPDEIVDVQHVELWQSALVIDALALANIDATALDHTSAQFTLATLRPMARIMVRAGDAREADAIITKTLHTDGTNPA